MRFLIFLLFPMFLYSQNDSLRFPKPSKSDVILVGYQASFDPKDDENDFKRLKTVHILEVNYSKIYDRGGIHPASLSYYFGNDFVLNFNQFIIGPKMGFNISGNALSFGSELSFYTNFKEIKPRFIPFVGMGFYGSKLFVSFPIQLSKSDFVPVNKLNVGITIPIYNLNKKKFEIINKN